MPQGATQPQGPALSPAVCWPPGQALASEALGSCPFPPPLRAFLIRRAGGEDCACHLAAPVPSAASRRDPAQLSSNGGHAAMSVGGGGRHQYLMRRGRDTAPELTVHAQPRRPRRTQPKMATAPAPNLGLMGRTGPQANSKLTTKPTRVMCTQNAKHAKGPKNKGSRGQVQGGICPDADTRQARRRSALEPRGPGTAHNCTGSGPRRQREGGERGGCGERGRLSPGCRTQRAT